MQQHGIRLNRPVIAYDKWVNRMPEEYARNLLDDNDGPYPETPEQDEKHALALLSTTEVWCRWHKKHENPFFTSLQPTVRLAAMLPRQ